jgi:hypothetical protein
MNNPRIPSFTRVPNRPYWEIFGLKPPLIDKENKSEVQRIKKIKGGLVEVQSLISMEIEKVINKIKRWKIIIYLSVLGSISDWFDLLRIKDIPLVDDAALLTGIIVGSTVGIQMMKRVWRANVS